MREDKRELPVSHSGRMTAVPKSLSAAAHLSEQPPDSTASRLGGGGYFQNPSTWEKAEAGGLLYWLGFTVNLTHLRKKGLN